MRDIVSKWGTLRLALPLPAAGANYTSTTGDYYGTPIELTGYNGCVFYILSSGTFTNGIPSFTIRESYYDDTDAAGSAPEYNEASATDQWQLVPDGQLIAWAATSATDFTPVRKTTTSSVLAFPQTSGTDPVHARIGYTGGAKWVQINLNIASGTSGVLYYVLVGLGEPRLMPAPV